MPRKQIYQTANDTPAERHTAAQRAYTSSKKIKRVAIDMSEDKINLIKSFAADHGLTMIALFTKAIDYYMRNYDSINAADQVATIAAADPVQDTETKFER